MPALLPLLLILSPLTALKHHAPVHHPYVRPHHLRTAGPGPRIKPAAEVKAQAQAAAQAEEEPVEDIESVEPANMAPAGGANAAATPGAGLSGAASDHVFGVAPDPTAPLSSAAGGAAALGHLHAALVHLPIAWILLWALVEVLGLVIGGGALNASALFLGVLTLLSFAPSALSGLCRLDELTSATKGYEAGEALWHRNLLFAAAGLSGFCVILRLIHWRWPNNFCRILCVLGVVAAAIVTGYSAHLGGRLVYGADFLPF